MGRSPFGQSGSDVKRKAEDDGAKPGNLFILINSGRNLKGWQAWVVRQFEILLVKLLAIQV